MPSDAKACVLPLIGVTADVHEWTLEGFALDATAVIACFASGISPVRSVNHVPGVYLRQPRANASTATLFVLRPRRLL